MIRKYGIVLLAALGAIAIVAATLADTRSGPAAVGAPLASAPYRAFVAGTGIVEPLGGSIAVGTPVAGIVSAVAVRPGDKVKAGAVLFRIDDGDLLAQRPALSAALEEARARSLQAHELYQLALQVPDQRAVSGEEMLARRSAVKVADAAVAAGQARLAQLGLEQGRRTVRALVSGQVLQVNLRPGEFASAAPAKPLILMAGDERLALRVDIDEFEASRVQAAARASAYPRGGPAVPVALTFERIEPAIVAKTSLTGSGTERVDARVLQVLYSVAPGGVPVFVGQQMDVYIEAPPAPPAR